MKRFIVPLAAVGLALAVVGAAFAYAGRPGPPAGTVRGAGMMGGAGIGGMMGGAGIGGMMGGAFTGTAGAQQSIRMMIPHHEQAVAMAKLAQQQATHAQVRELAASIEKTQTQEIAQMRAWYKQWYGADVPTIAMPGMTATLTNADPFDQAFLAAMIRHHTMGVRMIAAFQSRVDKSELSQLMQTMSQTQQREITQMQGWYADWYGTAAAPSGGYGYGMGRGGGCGGF